MTASRGGSRTSRAAAGPGVSGPRARIASAVRPPARVSPWGLLRAAHGGPTVAVTTLVAVLAAGQGRRSRDRAAARRRRAHRPADDRVGQRPASTSAATARSDAADKPLATGELPVAAVRARAGGWRPSRPWSSRSPSGGGPRWSTSSSSSARARPTTSASRRTALSWLPYAVAFGTLPAVVTLAGPAPAWPEAWLMLAAGTPRRRGALPQRAAGPRRRRRHRRARPAAPAGGDAPAGSPPPALLVTASLAALLGRDGAPEPWAWGLLAVVLALAAGQPARTRPRRPSAPRSASRWSTCVLVALG